MQNANKWKANVSAASALICTRYPDSPVESYFWILKKKLKCWTWVWFVFNLCVQILGYADYAFTSIFTVEILLKVNIAFSSMK